MEIEAPCMSPLPAGTTADQISYADALESMHKNSNWWTVFAAFDLADFKQSHTWIATKTGLGIAEVLEALDGLTILGYLQKINGDYFQVKGKNHFNAEVTKRPKAEVIEGHALLTQQILNHMSADSTVLIQQQSLAANKEILQEFYADVEAAYQRAFAKSNADKSKNDAIYKISISGVDVIPRKNSSGQDL